nr:hypothetical protein [Tanacetum cinerariifolium]
MAQQVIPAAQLVPRFYTIRRCNNYALLQSIPCSPECKIIGKILLDHPLNYALTVTADVPTMVGYQGVDDLVSTFYTKNPAQPWQTMLKKVVVRGMLIPNAFLTEEIRATDDFKESTPRAHRKPALTASLQGKKRNQIAGESCSPRKSHKITIRKKKQSTTPIPPPENIARVQEKLDKEEIEKMVKGDDDEESYASEFVDLILNVDVDDSKKKDEEIEKEKKDDNVKKMDEVVKEKYIVDDVTGSMEIGKE